MYISENKNDQQATKKYDRDLPVENDSQDQRKNQYDRRFTDDTQLNTGHFLNS